jgi:HPt (histidine-containing phosphotransfer) domain-containing protein
MLIYNYQKEFLGIDEKDLKTLGFETLAELKAEVNDFADLFVKTPGYIHNFKHVHWIDFVAYANEGEESKVLISINAKTFTAKITLQRAYLADHPSKTAFFIHLNGLRSLSNDETQNIASEAALKKELPEVKHEEPVVIVPTPEPIAKEETLTQQEPLSTPTETMLDVGDLSIDIDESLFEEDIANLKPQNKAAKNPDEPLTLLEEEPLFADENIQTAPQSTNEYDFTYDPNIASRELGLPLDLIEEFIEDFIAQANEFKIQIYNSLEDGDIDTVKTLAHKLKGVAANLRVENAHEVLASISATSDAGVIREYIDTFYIIMQKLEGNEAQQEEATQTIEVDDFVDDDDYITLVQEETKQEEPATKQEDFSIPPSYSKEAVAKEIGLSKEDFNELFLDYENEARTILTKIKTAAESEDFTTVHNEALKLKGMSDNMRLQEFTQELSEIMHSQDKVLIIATVELLEKQLQDIAKMEE